MSRIETEFGKERNSGIFSIKPKYYIFSEGDITERRYFKKLNTSVLSKNVEIINILRDYANIGESNPSNIIRLIEELLIANSNEITIKEVKNKLRNWSHEFGKDINPVLKLITKKYKDNKIVKYGELRKFIFEFFSGEIYLDLSKNFMKYLSCQDITYSPNMFGG